MSKPKRDRARWLHEAPEYVTACRDNGGKTCDRYTVYIGGSLAMTPTREDSTSYAAHMNSLEEYLGMSGGPRHPQGFSQWGEAPRGNRRASGKPVRWLDLPPHIRAHVVSRCTPTRTPSQPSHK